MCILLTSIFTRGTAFLAASYETLWPSLAWPMPRVMACVVVPAPMILCRIRLLWGQLPAVLRNSCIFYLPFPPCLLMHHPDYQDIKLLLCPYMSHICAYQFWRLPIPVFLEAQ
jgi:hypothetical protein